MARNFFRWETQTQKTQLQDQIMTVKVILHPTQIGTFIKIQFELTSLIILELFLIIFSKLKVYCIGDVFCNLLWN